MSLGGASTLAASVLASGASFAATAAALGPDGELLALRRPWLASVQAFEEALTALDEAETRAARPPPLMATDFEDDPNEERYFVALEERDIQRAEADYEAGVTAAIDLEGRTGKANRAIVDQIVETPARTVAGIRFKVKVSINEAHLYPDLIASIMEDIVALADRTRGLVI